MLGCEHEQGGFAMNAREAIEEEKPLDPATERVRRKMVRLLVVSISVMMVGLMAVLGAVVYKINDKPAQSLAANNGAKVPMEPGFEGRIDLPPGAEMIASSLDGSNILLSVRLAGGDSQLLVYSLAEDRIVARVAID
ncbi:MAG: fimbrial protein [Nitratireductor sp.]|nr:fimbrial protein [Nitratireductor sp.]MCB1460166.1 fimbrial protein [Nitratireductor sp.]